jgi:hypothetical protein
MEMTSNIYRYNLDILSNLEQNQTIYYEQNQIFVDDRYFGKYRYGNNPLKIIEIIKFSFLHYYNLLLMNLYEIEKHKDMVDFLKSAISGLKKITNEDNENFILEDKILFEKLKDQLLTLLIELQDRVENFDEETDSDESDSDESDSETCLKSMLRTTEEHLRMNDSNVIVNTIYVVKNQVTRMFLGIVHILCEVVNFN